MATTVMLHICELFWGEKSKENLKNNIPYLHFLKFSFFLCISLFLFALYTSNLRQHQCLALGLHQCVNKYFMLPFFLYVLYFFGMHHDRKKHLGYLYIISLLVCHCFTLQYFILHQLLSCCIWPCQITCVNLLFCMRCIRQ